MDIEGKLCFEKSRQKILLNSVILKPLPLLSRSFWKANHSSLYLNRSSPTKFLFFFLLFGLLPLLFLTFLLLSLLSQHLQAATLPPHLFFRNTSIEQGLSQNSVLSVARDQFGFLWFGTESGLNKFDGYRFTVYLPIESDPHSLSNSWINALLVDRQGNLWVGTENGLNRYVYSRDRFERYLHDPANSDSISSSRIFCLFEDRQGRLWVGTDRGLNLFDRTRQKFIRYRSDPAQSDRSLSNDNIRAIAQDSMGLIWVGTAGGGLNILDPETGRITQLRAKYTSPAISTPGISPTGPTTAQTIAYLPDDHIFAIYIEPRFNEAPLSAQSSVQRHSDRNSEKSFSTTPTADIIWLGTASSGLIRYDPALSEFRIYRSDPANPLSISDNSVNCILKDQDGTFWIGTDAGGLNHFNPHSETFVAFENKPGDPASLADNRVLSLTLSPERILWVGTYRGISQLNLKRQLFRRFLANPYDPASLISHPAVRAFCDHSSGIIFVGTDGGGITGFSRRTRQVIRLRHNPAAPNSPNFLTSDRVFCLLEDRDTSLWIATYGGGLNHYNPATGKFIHYRHQPGLPGSLPDNSLRSLYLDSEGTLWVGTVTRGLAYFDRNTRRFLRPEVSKIIKLSGEGKPEILFSSDDEAFSPPPPPFLNPLLSGRIFWITGDARGQLWIAAYDTGVLRYNPSSGELLILTHDPLNPASLSTNSVITVFVDRRDNVWVGTNGGGLCLISQRQPAQLAPDNLDHLTITRYNESHGLPSSVIYAILEDEDGYLWLSSNRGLSRFDPRTGQFRNFDTSDGLQSYEFNGNAAHKGRNGLLYFGGINGFNSFNPREIHFSDFIPPVCLTDIFVNNVRVKPGQPISGRVVLERAVHDTRQLDLIWKHRVISFEFVALDYTCPEKNKYAYKLEGFDPDWNYAGTRRFASYSNLPPGQYTLRIKATNADGLWNEAGTTISIRVIPPFWRTIWFYLIYVLLGVGLVYTIIRFRLRQARQREKELERQVAERTEELRLANEKLKFLATTDELTGLANYRRFRDYLEYEWRRSARAKKPVALLIIDLDNFKQFNDSFGHQAGDECLKQIALVLLKSCRRPGDLACRYGGDEFAVVLPETDTAGAYLVAERIRSLVAELDCAQFNFKKIGSVLGEIEEANSSEASSPHQPSFEITVCVGVSTMNPAEGGSTEELIARADQALYRAKTAGRNCTHV